MPFSVLGDQVPYSLLFPNQPLFVSLHGCTFFVHTLALGQDKLSDKAIKCIFLGYSHLQRGYRCYSPDTHRYFIFADVTFFEHSSLLFTIPPSSLEVLSPPLIFPILALSFESPTTPHRPLQVYTRRLRTDTRPPNDLSPMAPFSTLSVLSSPTDPHIAIRKGTRSFHNPHPIYTFLSYHRLFSPYSTFISTLSFVYIPHIVHEALSHLVPLPSSKSSVGYRWVYTIKISPDGRVDRLKACLVAKRYT